MPSTCLISVLSYLVLVLSRYMICTELAASWQFPYAMRLSRGMVLVAVTRNTTVL